MPILWIQQLCALQNINIGDRLVVKGQSAEFNIPLTQAAVIAENKWTQGLCFNTMGLHFWRDVNGVPITTDTKADNFFPMFLMYNNRNLNSFGFAFNAYFDSKRYEHPTTDVIGRFMNPVPNFFYDPKQSNGLSTIHIYLDSKSPLSYAC